MRYIEHNTRYDADYIMRMSSGWRLAVIEEIIERDVSSKRWDVRRALLSHTPMSKESARHLESEIRDIEKAFTRALRPFSRRKIDFSKPVVSNFRVEQEPGDNLGDLAAGLEVKHGGNRQ